MLTVEAVKLKPFFVAGHTFEMTCKVSSKNIKTPRYSVLITAEKPLADQSNPNGTTRIISLNQDSVVRLEDWTDQTRVDGVVLEKVQENEFRYRMYQTQISDAGLYRCVVTAWSPGGGGMWREAVNGLSNPIQIDFQTSGWYCIWWARVLSKKGESLVTLFHWLSCLWEINCSGNPKALQIVWWLRALFVFFGGTFVFRAIGYLQKDIW